MAIGFQSSDKFQVLGSLRDVTAPSISTARLDDTALTLTYDENLDQNSVPPPGSFAVTVAGSSRSVASGGVAISGADVRLTLSPSAVGSNEAVRVQYTPGTNPLKDLAGNLAGPLFVNFNSVAEQDPTISVSADKTVAVWNEQVALTATASDPDGGAVTVAWTASAGKFVSTNTPAATGLTVQWTADQSVTAEVTATVTDNEGATATATVSLTSHQAPIISVSASLTTIEVEQATTLTATASDPDGGELTVVWQVGPPYSHSNAEFGSRTALVTTWTPQGSRVRDAYTLICTVTDDEGATASASIEIVVVGRGAPRITSVAITSTPDHDADGNGEPDTYSLDEKIAVEVTFSEGVFITPPSGVSLEQVCSSTSVAR